MNGHANMVRMCLLPNGIGGLEPEFDDSGHWDTWAHSAAYRGLVEMGYEFDEPWQPEPLLLRNLPRRLSPEEREQQRQERERRQQAHLEQQRLAREERAKIEEEAARRREAYLKEVAENEARIAGDQRKERLKYEAERAERARYWRWRIANGGLPFRILPRGRQYGPPGRVFKCLTIIEWNHVRCVKYYVTDPPRFLSVPEAAVEWLPIPQEFR